MHVCNYIYVENFSAIYDQIIIPPVHHLNKYSIQEAEFYYTIKNGAHTQNGADVF